MVKLVRLQHLGVKSSVGRSLSRSAVRREFVRIGDEGGGPSGHQMDRIHGGNISPAREFMRLRSGSVGSDTVRLGLPKMQKRVPQRTTLSGFVVFCVTLVSLIGWGMGGVGGVVVCSVHRGLRW